jgi:hypothetical protein
MDMVNISVCRLAEDPRFKIKVSVDGKTNKIKYLNIITGEECENPDLVLLSTNINNEINNKWRYLIEAVKNDKRLYKKVLEGSSVIEY